MAEAVFAFTGKAIVTSVISTIISKNSYLDDLLKGEGMEAAKSSLERKLPQIEAVMRAVNQGLIKQKNESLEKWLWQFRDAVEKAEDVLDEIEYYKLEEKVKSRDGKLSAVWHKCKKKSVSFYNRAFNAGTLKKLRKAVKGLDTVAAGVVPFLDLVKGLGGVADSTSSHQELHGNRASKERETGPLFTERVLLGRKKEKGEVVEWLTKPVGDENEVSGANVSAFTVYGLGGLGKTTLAKLIYHDERVKRHFDVDMTVWVCVSDCFDVEVITKKILEAMTNERPNVDYLPSLQDILMKKLNSKKFFLVLDDVWDDENEERWEKLMAPLKCGARGSKILVTSRMESVAGMVAKVLGGKKGFLKLKGLKDNDMLSLFKKYAFAGVSIAEYKHLEPIGEEIAKKLWGCPLAAKVVGGMLNNRMNYGYWSTILREGLSGLQTHKDGILGVLKLSYDNLPPHLQACFRYCSLFPQDYRFEKDVLIKMWMGSRLIPESINTKQRPEDIGEEYFDHLRRKSFFELNWGSYLMHDLLHELARAVSSGECLRNEDNCLQEAPDTVRHLCVKTTSIPAIAEITRLKSLRSLVLELEGKVFGANDVVVLGTILENLKSLRLLRLFIRGTFVFPNAICELIHLRHLYVGEVSSPNSSKNELDRLPRSVYRLYHLQVIDFREQLSKIDVEEMTNLINLRYLKANTISIPWIGKLASLQKLSGFQVSKERGHSISELKHLKDLRELSISCLEQVRSPEEAADAKLYERENLASLLLAWDSKCGDDACIDGEVLDKLQPYSCREELTIDGYRGSRSPFWMEDLRLVSLTQIKLSSCKKWERLPPLGILPSLKYLSLDSLPAVVEINHSFYGIGHDCAFRSLMKLRVINMPNLDSWDVPHDKDVFPQLKKLTIRECPKLKELPTLPLSLTELMIYGVGLNSLPKMYQSPGNNNKAVPSKPLLASLVIEFCDNLTSLGGFMVEQQENLQHLEITQCKKLAHLPVGGFASLLSLKGLFLYDCPLLVHESHDNLLPSTLSSLFIYNCSLDTLFLNSLQCLTSLNDLTLQSCSNIKSLPSSEVLARLTALHRLSINDCKVLSSLGGLGGLVSLRDLRILGCDRLKAVASSLPNDGGEGDTSSSSLKLDYLGVEHQLLRMEPLRSLCHTRELDLYADSELTALPEQWLLQNCTTLRVLDIHGGSHLQSLPSSMASLSSLRNLRLSGCPLMQSLPNLPRSLNYISIRGGHPILKERYKSTKR